MMIQVKGFFRSQSNIVHKEHPEKKVAVSGPKGAYVYGACGSKCTFVSRNLFNEKLPIGCKTCGVDIEELLDPRIFEYDGIGIPKYLKEEINDMQDKYRYI